MNKIITGTKAALTSAKSPLEDMAAAPHSAMTVIAAAEKDVPPATSDITSTVSSAREALSLWSRKLAVASVYDRRIFYARALLEHLNGKSDSDIAGSISTSGLAVAVTTFLGEAKLQLALNPLPARNPAEESQDPEARRWSCSRAESFIRAQLGELEGPFQRFSRTGQHGELLRELRNLWRRSIRSCIRDEGNLLTSAVNDVYSTLKKPTDDISALLQREPENATLVTSCRELLALVAELERAGSHLKKLLNFKEQIPSSAEALTASRALETACHSGPRVLAAMLSIAGAATAKAAEAQQTTVENADRVSPDQEELQAALLRDLGFSETTIQQWAAKPLEQHIHLLLAEEDGVLLYRQLLPQDKGQLLACSPEELSILLADIRDTVGLAYGKRINPADFESLDHLRAATQGTLPPEQPVRIELPPGLLALNRITEVLAASERFQQSPRLDARLSAATLLFGFQWRGSLILTPSSFACIHSEVCNSLQALSPEVPLPDMATIKEQLRLLAQDRAILTTAFRGERRFNAGASLLDPPFQEAIRLVMEFYREKSGAPVSRKVRQVTA